MKGPPSSEIAEVILMLYVLTACVLGIGAGGHFMVSAQRERNPKMARKKEAYPREWDDDAAVEFTASDMLVLGDDGETVLFVPLTPAREEKGKYGPQMQIGVARVGDAEVAPIETWAVVPWPVGVRVFRRYCALRKEHGKGFEGSVILKLVRHGASGDQDTTYSLSVFLGKITGDAELAIIRKLTEEAFAG